MLPFQFSGKYSSPYLVVVFCAILLILVAIWQKSTQNVEKTESLEDKVQIRWFVGLEFGSDFNQIAVLEEIVADFNASQDEIELLLEVASIAGAYDMFATQISTDTGPDIVGPISWGVASGFPDQWLSLEPYLAKSDFDATRYNPNMLAFYQTEKGETISLPFSVAPSAIYYRPAMFDEIGMAYPPQVYGEKYPLNGRLREWNWDTLTEVAQYLTIDANNNNATQPQFDRSQIVQVGFHPQAQNMTALATFFGAAKIYKGDHKGAYESTIPDNWKAAWQWWHAGMWGEQPFIAPIYLAETLEFGYGNLFQANKAAMSLGQISDTCCLDNTDHSPPEFQVGILPIDENGIVNGRISETSFYIWQGTKHPAEAFTVLIYLLTTGSEKLLSAYDAMPAAADQVDAFIVQKSLRYPAVTTASWHVFVQGMAYPDKPSADQYLPHRNEAIDRLQKFGELLASTNISDFDAEFRRLQDDLTFIYNK